jgi:Protein of unknown function (DUF4038)/Domain of unknown function (DUF5060)
MGPRNLLPVLACAAVRLAAQTPCANTPTYSTCDMVFELDSAEAAAHPQPYVSVTLHAEFRSPHFKTFLMPAFWDGGRRLIIRFSPTEPGEWIYRLTSNLKRLEGQQGKFSAQDGGAVGFVIPANLHHWAYTRINDVGGNIPHLWMGDSNLRFAFLDDGAFRQLIDTRAAQKFNHMRGLVMGTAEDAAQAFPNPDQPNPEYFQRLDSRIKYINNKGLSADLVLAGAQNQLTRVFPNWQQRERYLRYIVARYAPMNVIWQGIEQFETYDNGREVLKEIGGLLRKLDPYRHPCSTDTRSTSAPVQDDGWQNFISYRSADDQVGAVEHQLYPTPFVNFEWARADANPDTLRHRLWNATMDGQYPSLSGTAAADSPAVKQMTAWYEFFVRTRHWELEPYFDVDGGRALALEGIEYIVYIEKPGPIEVLVEKHGYDVTWFNPVTGESIRQKKEFKGERFTGEAPDTSHDWVLHLSRESRKEGMLRSIKFDSREVPLELQELETNPAKVPFEIVAPGARTLSLAVSHPYAVKIKRETRATRSMIFLWQGEIAASGQGFRVIGTGAKGTFQIPPEIARSAPADMTVRVYGMNANGKVYAVNTAFGLTK